MVKLILLGDELLDGLARDPAATLARFSSNGIAVAPVAHKVAKATMNLHATTGATPPWLAYLGLRDGDHAVVGACAFKGPPIANAVEIVCYTFPGFEQRGYGAAMGGQLIEIAFAHDSVREVMAHTQPEDNAATRLVKRLGFDFHGIAHDKFGDEISRWSLRRRTQ
ncbi:MAG TPA: GNAT family protein [Alphaproteobacteria bacterium]|nr:GNAT family protein [Alphaproteobacteria bacterium]